MKVLVLGILIASCCSSGIAADAKPNIPVTIKYNFDGRDMFKREYSGSCITVQSKIDLILDAYSSSTGTVKPNPQEYQMTLGGVPLDSDKKFCELLFYENSEVRLIRREKVQVVKAVESVKNAALALLRYREYLNKKNYDLALEELRSFLDRILCAIRPQMQELNRETLLREVFEEIGANGLDFNLKDHTKLKLLLSMKNQLDINDMNEIKSNVAVTEDIVKGYYDYVIGTLWLAHLKISLARAYRSAQSFAPKYPGKDWTKYVCHHFTYSPEMKKLIDDNTDESEMYKLMLQINGE